jgi:hypothetical protein
MNRIHLALVILVLSGCGPLTTPFDHPDPSLTKLDEHASAADVWQSLANAVDRGTITTSQRLAQFVVVLARNGELSPDGVSVFEREFPDAAKSERLLGPADVKRLRQLGH